MVGRCLEEAGCLDTGEWQWALLTACEEKDLLASGGEEQNCPGPLRQSPSGLQAGEK